MKIGDTVKVVDSDYFSPELSNGQTGVVVHFVDADVVGVLMDNGKRPQDWADAHGDGGYNFYINQLELVND